MFGLLQSIFIIMQGTTNKMIPSQKIDLFVSHHKRNPEDIATDQLLLISDEYDPQDPLDHESPNLTKSNSTFSEKAERPSNHTRYPDNKLQEVGKFSFSKTHSQWRKASTRYIAGEEVCVMKPQKCINLSNYILLDGKGMNDNDDHRKEGIEQERSNNTIRPANNIVAYIRRRNLSSLKQQSNDLIRTSCGLTNRSHKKSISPLRRTNMSCELKKKDELSPRKNNIIEVERINDLSPQMRCNSPTFRNKRVTNYLRYRIGKS